MKKIKTTKRPISLEPNNRAWLAKRKIGLKRNSLKKKSNLSKKFGIFAVGVSLAFLVVFLAMSISSSVFPSATVNESVLGSSTGMMAPTSFTSEVKNYRVNLMWDNMVDGNYQYLIWVYNTTTKKYNPKAIGAGNAGIGTLITYSLDQMPGTSVLYRVSSCVGCSFDEKGNVDGVIGALSSGLIVRMPKIVAPDQFEAKAQEDGIVLSWDSIDGVDGYDIWRSTTLFGLSGYSRVGSVGLSGTFSARHEYKSDGTPKIPIDQASPTTFTDKKVAPGTSYYYRVSAKKTIFPITDSKSRTIAGAQSTVANVVAKDLDTPGFGLFEIENSSTSVEISIEVPKSNSISGYILYCQKCAFKKAKIIPGKKPSSKYITEGRVSSSGNTIYYNYVINSLRSDTTYSMALSKYRIVGSKVYESDKTTKSIDTPSISDLTSSAIEKANKYERRELL